MTGMEVKNRTQVSKQTSQYHDMWRV